MSLNNLVESQIFEKFMEVIKVGSNKELQAAGINIDNWPILFDQPPKELADVLKSLNPNAYHSSREYGKTNEELLVSEETDLNIRFLPYLVLDGFVNKKSCIKIKAELEEYERLYKSTAILSLGFGQGITLSHPDWPKAIAKAVQHIGTMLVKQERIHACFPNAIVDGKNIIHFNGNGRNPNYRKPAADVPTYHIGGFVPQPVIAYR